MINTLLLTWSESLYLVLSIIAHVRRRKPLVIR